MKGRPFVLKAYTEEQRNQLLRLVADGMTKSKALEAMGIPKDTLGNWLTMDEAFAVKWRRARVEQVHSIADEMLEIADEPVASMEEAHRNKLRVSARQWLVGKWAPKLYGDRVREDHTQRIAVVLLPAVDGAGGMKQLQSPTNGKMRALAEQDDREV